MDHELRRISLCVDWFWDVIMLLSKKLDHPWSSLSRETIWPLVRSKDSLLVHLKDEGPPKTPSPTTFFFSTVTQPSTLWDNLKLWPPFVRSLARSLFETWGWMIATVRTQHHHLFLTHDCIRSHLKTPHDFRAIRGLTLDRLWGTRGGTSLCGELCFGYLGYSLEIKTNKKTTRG